MAREHLGAIAWGIFALILLGYTVAIRFVGRWPALLLCILLLVGLVVWVHKVEQDG